MHDGCVLLGKGKASKISSIADVPEYVCDLLRQTRIFTFLKSAFSMHTHIGQKILDCAIIAIALAGAYVVRFNDLPHGMDAARYLVWLVVLVAVRVSVNRKLGIYRFIWRFVCLSDALVICGSLALVSSALLAVRLFYPGQLPLSSWVRLPVSVIILEYLLTVSGSLGARVTRRILYERSQRKRLGRGKNAKRVILYGAGRAGIMLLRELVNQSKLDIVGFVDDDPEKVGTIIGGLRVVGSGDSLEDIVRRTGADEVVISIAAANPASLTQILSKCHQIPISAKIIPSLSEIINKQSNIAHVREICIEDLLGRESVELAELDDDIRAAYADKRILVTGGGGTIGSELVRQLELLRPRSIVVLDKDENSVYDLEQEMKLKGSRVRMEPVIADIRNRERLFSIIEEYKPQVVFHAAAHKHVPLMERHPCEAVLNNVCGTLNLLGACRQYGVDRFVFISSDKAVNPTNIMGATKRLGELLVQSYARDNRMRLACVRFGNVMGSRGSVIPLFQKQIERGGPITITHPDVVRFFMTIPEASQLVLSAGSMAKDGEIFVFDMGSPRKILDLAQQMVWLCGFEPGKDIEIEITGLRPGEKMYEELVCDGEHAAPTRFEKISMIVGETAPEMKSLIVGLGRLIEAARANDRRAIGEILFSLEIGFAPNKTNRARAQLRADRYAMSHLWGPGETRAVGHHSSAD